MRNLQNKTIFLDDLYNTENEFKTRDEIKISYNLKNKPYFKWRQIVNSIPKAWKKVIKESPSDGSNLVLLDHQLFKNNRILSIYKMNSKMNSTTLCMYVYVCIYVICIYVCMYI